MKNIKNPDGIDGQNLKFPTKKENPDERERERRYDEALIELALEVVLDIGARSHVGRNEDVGPVICPSWVFVVFVGSRRYSLQFLRIFLLFSHFLFFLILSQYYLSTSYSRKN